MEVQKRNIIVIALIAILAVVVLVFAIIRLANGATYVRIVDTSAEKSLDGVAPGADIDAVAIEKWSGEERTGVWYAEVVQKDPYDTASASSVGDEATEENAEDAENTEESTTTKYTDAKAALGNPEDDEQPSFVALNGQELIVKVPKGLRKGMTLVVHEIGAVNAVKADSYEVYTSENPDGPWDLRGTGSGPFSVEITE